MSQKYSIIDRNRTMIRNRTGVTSYPPNEVAEDMTAEAALSLGDSHYVDEDYESAVDDYTSALSLWGMEPSIGRARTLSHRSAAYYKINHNNEALVDAETAISIKSSGFRTGEMELFYKRAGLAALRLGRYRRALSFLDLAQRFAVQFERDATAYDQWIQECKLHLSTPAASFNNKKLSLVERQFPVRTVSIPSPTTDETTPVSLSPRVSPVRTKSTPNYHYHQTETAVMISIDHEPKLRLQDIRVAFKPRELHVFSIKENKEIPIWRCTLFDEIVEEKCRVCYTEAKILIHLHKKNAREWPMLVLAADEKEASSRYANPDVMPRSGPGSEPRTDRDASRPRSGKIIPTTDAESSSECTGRSTKALKDSAHSAEQEITRRRGTRKRIKNFSHEQSSAVDKDKPTSAHVDGETFKRHEKLKAFGAAYDRTFAQHRNSESHRQHRKPLIRELWSTKPFSRRHRDEENISHSSLTAPLVTHPCKVPMYEYYQTDSVIMVVMEEANVRPQNLSVKFGPTTLSVVLTKDGVDYVVFNGHLFAEVVVNRCRVLYSDDKVLITMHKKDPGEWDRLAKEIEAR